MIKKIKNLNIAVKCPICCRWSPACYLDKITFGDVDDIKVDIKVIRSKGRGRIVNIKPSEEQIGNLESGIKWYFECKIKDWIREWISKNKNKEVKKWETESETMTLTRTPSLFQDTLTNTATYVSGGIVSESQFQKTTQTIFRLTSPSVLRR